MNVCPKADNNLQQIDNSGFSIMKLNSNRTRPASISKKMTSLPLISSFFVFSFIFLRIVFDGKDKTNIYDNYKMSISILAVFVPNVLVDSFYSH